MHRWPSGSSRIHRSAPSSSRGTATESFLFRDGFPYAPVLRYCFLGCGHDHTQK
jgi:hypothetical protein